jgi:hypothetical protein
MQAEAHLINGSVFWRANIATRPIELNQWISQTRRSVRTYQMNGGEDSFMSTPEPESGSVAPHRTLASQPDSPTPLVGKVARQTGDLGSSIQCLCMRQPWPPDQMFRANSTNTNVARSPDRRLTRRLHPVVVRGTLGTVPVADSHRSLAKKSRTGLGYPQCPPHRVVKS